MKRSSHLVLFDGDCPFCRAQVRLLKRLDTFKHFQFLPRSDPGVRELAPELALDSLPEAICCLSRAGGIHCGARCIRFMAIRMPVLLPLGMALWIPGVIGLAEWVYKRIAKNRYRLTRFACDEKCKTD